MTPKEFVDELTKIVDRCADQLSGRYGTESDAITALASVARLAEHLRDGLQSAMLEMLNGGYTSRVGETVGTVERPPFSAHPGYGPAQTINCRCAEPHGFSTMLGDTLPLPPKQRHVPLDEHGRK